MRVKSAGYARKNTSEQSKAIQYTKLQAWGIISQKNRFVNSFRKIFSKMRFFSVFLCKITKNQKMKAKKNIPLPLSNYLLFFHGKRHFFGFIFIAIRLDFCKVNCLWHIPFECRCKHSYGKYHANTDNS